MKYLKKGWFPALVVVLLLILVGGIGYWFHWGATRLDVMGHPPDFTLQNLQGQNVKFSSLDGKVRVVELFYATCPNVCPTTTAHLVQLQNELKKEGHFGKDVEFVSITFDPKVDTPQVLQTYAKNMGMDPSGWLILRGTEQATHQVASNYGMYVERQPDGSYVHTTVFFLVDENGQIRGKYEMGDNTPNAQVLQDIHNLLQGNKFLFNW